MQNKTVWFVLMGLGAVILLIFGYTVYYKMTYLRLQGKFIPGSTVSSTIIEIPNQTPDTKEPISSGRDPLDYKEFVTENGTKIFFDVADKNSETNQSYGIFIQKPNQEKKLIANKIHNIFFGDGYRALYSTINPNIILAHFEFVDVGRAEHYYFIDIEKETFIMLDTALSTGDAIHHAIETPSKEFSLGLTTSKNCWIMEENKCDVGAQKTHPSIQVNGKVLLNTPNLTSICGEAKGLDGWCEENPDIYIKITGVDTLFQKVFFSIHMGESKPTNYVFDTVKNTVSLTQQTPDLDLIARYYDRDLDIRFEYDSKHWEQTPSSENSVISLQGRANFNSSVGDYYTDNIRIESTHESFEHFRDDLIKADNKISETNPATVDGKSATQIWYNSTDDIKRSRTAVFVPRLTDALVITFDDTKSHHRDFVKNIKILEDEWYTDQPLGQEQKRIILHNKSTQNICQQLPYPTDIGRMIYPVDPKYTVAFFNELFTAADCNNGSINTLFGVENDNYTLGSLLTLKTAPSVGLLKVLTDMSFQCNQKTIPANCTEWILTDFSVPVKNILKLQPFYKEFSKNDCKNCG